MMRRATGILIGTLLLAACAPEASNAERIAVTLTNDHITLDRAEVAAGTVLFEVENQSDDLVHEIEIFAKATDGAVLPVSNSVADTTGFELIDEVEDVLPGSRASLTVDLAPGTYLAICNLPLHYGSGMWAYLTVIEG